MTMEGQDVKPWLGIRIQMLKTESQDPRMLQNIGLTQTLTSSLYIAISIMIMLIPHII